MKRISVTVLALFVILALGACTEVPVRQVEKCAQVVDVQLFKDYFFGIFTDSFDVEPYRVLDNGRRVRTHRHFYQGGVGNWLELAKEVEIGKQYCWTEYEKLK